MAAYGLYVFLDRDLIGYMLVRTRFVSLDYEEPEILFCLDYLAMAGFFVWTAHHFAKRLRKRSAIKKRSQMAA
jgi:hypothetical protein